MLYPFIQYNKNSSNITFLLWTDPLITYLITHSLHIFHYFFIYNFYSLQTHKIVQLFMSRSIDRLSFHNVWRYDMSVESSSFLRNARGTVWLSGVTYRMAQTMYSPSYSELRSRLTSRWSVGGRSVGGRKWRHILESRRLLAHR